MMVRTYAYYSRIAESIGRADVEFNVLLVVGGSMGVMMIPIGVGFGLIVAVAINLGMVRFHLGPFSRSKDNMDGSSWVIHRGRADNSSGHLSQ